MLRKNAFDFFKTSEIEPKGWLKRQLEIQMNGLSGHLYEIWPDIKESKWIGGDKEGWERVPYWLDGFIPLSYLLRDSEKIAVCKKYIDAILSQQKEDGWICPCEDSDRARYDVWAVFLICKVLVEYAECSGDERILEVVKKTLKNLRNHIRGNTLFNWGQFRWFECLIPIYWTYEKTHEDWLIYLANMLNVQGADYEALYDRWMDQLPRREWQQHTHVVNMAMALKSVLLSSKADSNPNALKKAQESTDKIYDNLMKYHGTAVGHFNGDECLSGTSPIQGTELCSVVEAMYSYELNFAVSGDYKWLDRLETLAYNCLPATISPDMWTHQYDQMVNQISCTVFKDKNIFLTNSRESHLFGLEPNYGCCTANFNQGWPKYARSVFMKSDDSVLIAAIAPSELKTKINGKNVFVSIDTEYPFNNVIVIKSSSDLDNFKLKIRIPSFVNSANVNGKRIKSGAIVDLSDLKGKNEFRITFNFRPQLLKTSNNMYVVRNGPLFYSVDIKEKWIKHEYIRNGVERKYPYCDYEIKPQSKWNYAFSDVHFKVHKHSIKDYPFSSKKPPITLTGYFSEIDWGFEEGFDDLCASAPHSLDPIGKKVVLKMKPYGCTNLRITELPFVDNNN